MSNHPLRHIFAFALLCTATYLLGWGIMTWSNGSAKPTLAKRSNLEQTDPGPVLKVNPVAHLDLPETRAFLAVYLAPDGTTKILATKNASAPLPIASITKLMTALVALDNLDPLASTTLAHASSTFTRNTLLKAMLVESNNNSAEALAKLGGRDNFLTQMNALAKALGMAATVYANPSGLDDDGPNLSSANDLLTLVKTILRLQPEIFKITREPSAAIVNTDGQTDHVAHTTNELLVKKPVAWPAEIVGGKTGTTNLAKTNLVLVLRDKQSGGKLINIVLGSEHNFDDMTKLVNWVYENYQF